jgi:hypothetical protein
MPRIYRAMRATGEGSLIGHESNDTLGIRVKVLKDGRAVGDVTVIDGLVRLQEEPEGMSVSPSPEELPPHLIPKEFRARYPAARRNNKPPTCPWRTGAGAFEAGPLSDKLQLRLDVDDPTHGLVGPNKDMLLEELRGAIEATQPAWIRENW